MKRLTTTLLALAAGGALALLSFDTQPAMAYDGPCPTAIDECGTATTAEPVCINGICEYVTIPLMGQPNQS